MIFPIPQLSVHATVTIASAQFSAVLATDSAWIFVSTVDCWISQSGNPTATAGAGSLFCAAGRTVMIDAKHGAKVAVIRHATDGAATLTPVGSRAV